MTMKRNQPPRSGHFAFAHQNGTSMIEVLTGLGIAAVLGTLAVGVSSIIQNHATTAEVNGLMADLAFVRSTAINLRKTVTLCASVDGTSCSTESPWSKGWIVFSDENRNRKIDGEDRLLRVRSPLAAGTTLEYGSGYYRYLMYNSNGMVFPGATFTFCSTTGYKRAIIVYWTGRPRVSKRTSAGKILTCKTS
jgi:type IV fimbrial biogenesis protein FimT